MRPSIIAFIALAFACPVQAQLAAHNEAGVTFGHMHLNVTDVELHKQLWTDLFDAVLAEKGGYAAVELPGALIFFTEAEPTAPSVESSVDHFGVTVRDIGDILAKWRTLGLTVDDEFDGTDGIPRAYITFPDGTRLELLEDAQLSVTAEMHHVHFYTPQNRELMNWYADLFGAIPRARGSIATTADVPGANLSFTASEGVRMATEGTAIDHVGLEVEDMEAFAEVLRGKGIEFVFGPLYIEDIDLWVAFFADPSGAMVEVTAGMDKWSR